MLQQGERNRIEDIAKIVNTASEKYQLIHATFAIEKMFKDKMQEHYQKEYEAIRQQLLNEEDEDKREQLYQSANDLQKESNKKIKILIDYLPQIKDNSARITKTHSNTFLIMLPKSMENIRDDDGNIDFKKLAKLRHLMSHELGHIVLHSGVMDFGINKLNDISNDLEEEADCFAEHLIMLRKKRNEEIYKNKNFENI